MTTPAGWYDDPSRRDELRWWDGTAWTTWVHTDRVVRRSNGRASLSWVTPVLSLFGFAAFVFVGLLLLGDPLPSPRYGVTRGGDELIVVSAVCPGERLTDVLVFHPDIQDEPGSVLWSAHGEVDYPDELRLGTVLPGMIERIPLQGSLENRELVEVDVRTSRRYGNDSLRFDPSEVAEGEIVAAHGTYTRRADFLAASFDRTPCDDPYNRDRERSVALGLGGGLVVLWAAFIAAIVWASRRRRTMPHWPPPDTNRPESATPPESGTGTRPI